PTAEASVEKAALGAESTVVLTVVQADCAPLAEVVHPGGNAGAVTASKFSAKTTPVWPSAKGTVTVPRLAAPSCNWSVAVMLPPHGAFAVKVKGWLTGAPPAETTP